jgi:hypothetical protein
MARSSGIIRVIKALGKGRKTKGSFASKLATIGGGGGALLAGGLGYINSLIDKKINDFSNRQQPEYSMSDLGFAPKKEKTSSEISTINLSDIINAVSVIPIDIVPELGPTQDQYAIHLNLIIKRVAKLESAVSTQAKLIAKLEKAIFNYNENTRKENLNKRRKEKEDDIEETFAQKAARNIIDKTKDVASTIGSIVKPFLLPIAALALAAAASASDEEDSEEPIVSDNILDNIGNALDFMETTAVSTVMASSSLAKVMPTAAGAVANAASNAASMIKSSSTVTTMANMVNSVKASIGGKTAPIINAVSKFGDAAKANTFIQSISSAMKFLDGISKQAGKIVESVKSFVSSLPSSIAKIIKAAGKKIVKWYLVWQALQFMFRSAQMYAIGNMTAEKFHAGNKEQINNIIKVMGAPWVLLKIGLLAGTPFSPVGAAFGAIIGFVVGLIWGDEIYDVIGMDSLVNMLYDWIVLRKDITAEASQMWSKITNYFTKQLPNLIKDAIIEFGSNLKNNVTSFITAPFEKVIGSNNETNVTQPTTPDEPLKTRVMTNDGFKELSKEEIQQGIQEGTIKRSIGSNLQTEELVKRENILGGRNNSLSELYDGMTKSELATEAIKGNHHPEFHAAMYKAGFSDEEVEIAIDAGYAALNRTQKESLNNTPIQYEDNEKSQQLKSAYAKYQQSESDLKSFENSNERGTFKIIEDKYGFTEEKVYDDPEEQTQYKALSLQSFDSKEEFSDAKGDSFDKIKFLQSVDLLPQNFQAIDVSGNKLDKMIEDYLKKDKTAPYENKIIEQNIKPLEYEEAPVSKSRLEMIPNEHKKDYDLSKKPVDLIEQYSQESTNIFEFNANKREEKLVNERELKNRQDMLSGSDDYWQHRDTGLIDEVPHMIMKEHIIKNNQSENNQQKSNVDVKLTDIVPTTKQKKNVVVIPLVIPQNNAKSNAPLYNAGAAPASIPEPATPSLSTNDRFLDYSLVT